MNWSTFFLELYRIGNKYFLVAGIFFVLFYWIFRKRNAYKKIQLKYPRTKDYYREIGFSAMSILIFVLPALIILDTPSIRVHSTFYYPMSKHSMAYFFFAFLPMLLIHDTYFYWMHRLIHHPSVFKWVHLVHHTSTNPSPWAAYAFHPVEAVLESLVFVIILFTLPVTGYHLLFYFLFSIIYNVYGHLGFELYPSGFQRTWIGRWINTSVCHNQHHHFFKGNYGLYFLFWDRAMGTLRRDYDASFDEVTSRKKGPASTDADSVHNRAVHSYPV
jgi:lathosterol oxidase